MAMVRVFGVVRPVAQGSDSGGTVPGADPGIWTRC